MKGKLLTWSMSYAIVGAMGLVIVDHGGVEVLLGL